MTHPAAQTLPSDDELFSALPVAVLLIDAAGNVRGTYAAAEELFQLGRTALLGRSLAELPSLGAEAYRLFQSLAGAHASLHRSDVAVAPVLGDVDRVDISFNQMPDTDEYILTIHPKRLSALLVDGTPSADAGKTLSALASMLAHEIKNPLAGIKGAAQLAQRALPEAKHHLSTLIQREVDRIGKLVDDFDTVERFDAVALKPVNVHSVLDHVVALVDSKTAPLKAITKQYDPSLPPALAHEDALIQVLLNVLNNAQNAAGADADIVVQSRYRRGLWMRGDDNIRRQLPIEISISDNGPGIDPQISDRIFDPFVSAQEGGTGLGLTVAARLMNAMQGRIRAHNPEGGGACFTLHLTTAG